MSGKLSSDTSEVSEVGYWKAHCVLSFKVKEVAGLQKHQTKKQKKIVLLYLLDCTHYTQVDFKEAKQSTRSIC